VPHHRGRQFATLPFCACSIPERRFNAKQRPSSPRAIVGRFILKRAFRHETANGA
jgi:hypothetical protein